MKTRQQLGFTIVELLIVVVVIAVLAAITVVAYNGIVNRAKASAQVSDLASWKKKSEVYKVQNNIECPANYAFVYGNATLGTGDFCVMKYEAKIQGNDVGGTTYNASMVAESRPTGTPWASISQTQAITEAAETGGHLITEAEWMTIAADVLGVKYNWSGGAVGVGFIHQGHVNNNPGNAIAASANDTDTLNGMTGINTPRTFYLKSGDAIWDFSGNVSEWTSGTITGSQPGISGYAWREYFNIASWGNLASGSRPSTLASITGLSSITAWGSDNALGSIYSNGDETGSRGFIRGGTWVNSDSAVLTLNLQRASSYTAANIGFRVVR